jgi:hypothetical protein
MSGKERKDFAPPAAVGAGGDPHEHTDRIGHERREARPEEDQARTVEQAGEDIAALVVGAEPIGASIGRRGQRGLQEIGRGLRQGIVERKDVRENGDEDPEEDEDAAEESHRRFAQKTDRSEKLREAART